MCSPSLILSAGVFAEALKRAASAGSAMVESRSGGGGLTVRRPGSSEGFIRPISRAVKVSQTLCQSDAIHMLGSLLTPPLHCREPSRIHLPSKVMESVVSLAEVALVVSHARTH